MVALNLVEGSAVQRLVTSPWQVIAILLLAYILFGLFYEGRACSQSLGHPLLGRKRLPTSELQQAAYGELEFVSYTSSKMEQFFLQKLPEMNFPTEFDTPELEAEALTTREPPAAYCQLVNTYETQIMHWLSIIEEAKKTGEMFFDDEASKDVFSVYEFRYECKSDKAVRGYCTYKAMIEPLAFGLRHPVAQCYKGFPDKSKLLENKHDSLMDQSYLFYATQQLVDFGPHAHTHVDLGAAVNGGGGETHFLPSEYEKQGIEFSTMLMWEAHQVTGNVIFQTVPERWYHAYQYFNVPVSTNVSSEAHPLQVLKRVHPGTGFVSFKLDIDHNEIENTVVQTLIAWHDQYPFIKTGQFEFFFEQHVDLPMMRTYWHTTATESGLTLGDSYALFLKMRKLGIRAHGWI